VPRIDARPTVWPARAPEGRTDAHPFQLAVFGPEKLDAAATHRFSPVADEGEVDTLGKQLVDAVAVTALLGIERIELGLELGDDPARNRRDGRGRFDRDDQP